MYAAPFDYFRAGSLPEAHDLLRTHPGAKLLAGGHSLIPLLKLRLTAPPALIDIGRIAELKGITVAAGSVHIGALTTHAELAASDLLRKACPLIAEAAALIGDAQVRNVGTIGGNVAHADPASDLPTVLTALDARFIAAGASGSRTMAAGDFFQGLMTTALGEGDILTAIEVASRTPGQGMAYVKLTHPASRYAVVGAAAVVEVEGGMCTGARVAIGGACPVARRLAAVEAALVGKRPAADVIDQASQQAPGGLDDDVMGDIYASADYRKAMTVVYVKRALAAAFDRAT